jgi:hypothetical protein
VAYDEKRQKCQDKESCKSKQMSRILEDAHSVYAP